MLINYKLISDFIYLPVNVPVYIKIVVKKWFNTVYILFVKDHSVDQILYFVKHSPGLILVNLLFIRTSFEVNFRLIDPLLEIR